MKIKVCHFVNIITGKSDGVYAHLKMIFKYVNKDKYQHYLVFQGNPTIEKEVTELGVKVFSLPSLNKKFSIKTFIEFYDIIKYQEIDIVHAHLIKPYIIGGLSNIFLKKKLIFNYHGVFIKSVYRNIIEEVIYRISHYIICILNSVHIAIVPSEGSMNILKAETKLFKNILVYYNGSDINENPLDFTPDDRVINELKSWKKRWKVIVGVVARIEIQKRIDVALKIAKNVIAKHNDILFAFFGDGPLEKEMKSMSYKLGLNKNVIFYDYVPDFKYYIKYFDLLAFTSDWEGIPLTIWEAMASGVPIASTDVGGVKEILEKENCGLIFPKGNLEKGSKCIMELIENETLRIEMGKNGKKAISDKYNIKNFSSFFDNLYSKLMRNNGNH